MKRTRFRRWRRRLAATGATAALVTTLLVAPATPAAAVWQCRSWGEWPSYAYAVCDYGLGGVRVVYDCWYPSDGAVLRWRGPWKPAGQVSRGICGGGSYVAGTSYETF